MVPYHGHMVENLCFEAKERQEVKSSYAVLYLSMT